MPRPSGPPPNPDRVRRNKDPRAGTDGDWKFIDPSPNDEPIPDIPSWCATTERTREVYYFLAGLPQAREWSQGEWFQIWMTLPLLEKYFIKPGSEGLKAIMALLNGGLHLTVEDMHRARIRFKEVDPVEEELGEAAKEKVVNLNERRDRLTNASGE